VITRETPLDDLPELLRVDELARWCDCGTGVIYDSVKTGALASVRLGRLVRIPRSALVAWVRAAEQRAS
jgi:excisionase family DNA binding protein